MSPLKQESEFRYPWLKSYNFILQWTSLIALLELRMKVLKSDSQIQACSDHFSHNKVDIVMCRCGFVCVGVPLMCNLSVCMERTAENNLGYHSSGAIYFFFWDSISVPWISPYRLGWPAKWSKGSLVSISPVLRYQTCAITPCFSASLLGIYPHACVGYTTERSARGLSQC